MGESDLLTLAESSTEDSDLLALAKGTILDPLIGTMVEPKIQLIERILQRLDRVVERGQTAEEKKAQILKHVTAT
jgi:hypothetical protein